MARPQPAMKTTALKALPEQKQRAIWQHRRERLGIDWRQVSALSLRCAIAATLREGGALMIAGASGGRGVMLKVFLEGDPVKEYASTADELVELLDSLYESLGPGAEDLREALANGAD